MTVIHSPQELSLFLKEKFNLDQFTLSSLKPEASARDYYLVNITGQAFEHSDFTRFVISVNHKEVTPSDDFILVHDYLHRNDLPVPRILRVNHEEGLIWQEDLGNQDLSDFVTDNYGHNPGSLTAETRDYYRQAVQLLSDLKRLNPEYPVKDRFFDSAKLMFELDFLKTNAMKHLCTGHTGLAITPQIETEWKNLAAELDSYKDERICHRDFHSRNLKIKNNSVYMIDFQDARMGSRYYDLASLLYDPYVPISSELRNELFSYYHEKTNEKPDLMAFQSQVIQRILKALGTYIYQVYEKNNSGYAHYIQPALETLVNIFQEYRHLPFTAEWVRNLHRSFTRNNT